jgi:hypothetical protein
VTVVDGFRPADPRIQPDRFEENDACAGADSNDVNPATHIDLLAGFADTLTIDEAYEVDWFRFTVPEDPSNPDDPLPRLVTARAAARPFGAADSSNIGLAVMSLDSLRFGRPSSAGPEIPWLAESHAPGSTEILSAELMPGDYYLVVSDEGGVATRYALCLAIGNACTVPSAVQASR